ncbi:unnamed protein product, partial [Candidula unifasciata]
MEKDEMGEGLDLGLVKQEPSDEFGEDSSLEDTEQMSEPNSTDSESSEDETSHEETSLDDSEINSYTSEKPEHSSHISQSVFPMFESDQKLRPTHEHYQSNHGETPLEHSHISGISLDHASGSANSNHQRNQAGDTSKASSVCASTASVEKYINIHKMLHAGG